MITMRCESDSRITPQPVLASLDTDSDMNDRVYEARRLRYRYLGLQSRRILELRDYRKDPLLVNSLFHNDQSRPGTHTTDVPGVILIMPSTVP